MLIPRSKAIYSLFFSSHLLKRACKQTSSLSDQDELPVFDSGLSQRASRSQSGSLIPFFMNGNDFIHIGTTLFCLYKCCSSRIKLLAPDRHFPFSPTRHLKLRHTPVSTYSLSCTWLELCKTCSTAEHIVAAPSSRSI